jgi:hypothetical protein
MIPEQALTPIGLLSQRRPILFGGVELDDKSHEQPKRRERDDFVDQAFAAAGLPIVHMPAKRQYATAEVMVAIQAAISPGK